MILKKMIILTPIFICTISHAQIKSTKQIVDEAKSKIMTISIDELKTKMDNGEKFLLLDIRTEKEYAAGHIENAIWISRGRLEFAIQSKTKEPTDEIVIYCRGGARSALAGSALHEMGYEKIYNLEGGFKEWATAGHSVFNMHGEMKVINFEKKELAGE